MWRDDKLVVGKFTFDALRCGPSDGETILLLHGWPESNAQWRDVGPILAEAGYDVVGVTLQLYDHGAALKKKGACCAGQDIHDARLAADMIGIIVIPMPRPWTNSAPQRIQ